MIWAWSLVVIGGMAFQKPSEHWQVVVPGGDRAQLALIPRLMLAGAALAATGTVAPLRP